MDLYFYIKKEQQDSPQPYPFVEYSGSLFFQAYYQNRKEILSLLPDKSSVSQLDQTNISPQVKNIFEELEAGQEVSTDSLLLTLQPILSLPQHPYFLQAEELFIKLRKKGELRKLKKIHIGLDLRPIPADKEFVGSGSYVLLARGLCAHYKATQNLQTLSTLLKVNDLIISQLNELSSSEKFFLKETILQELAAILSLKEKLFKKKISERLVPVKIAAKSKKIIPPLGFLVQDKPRARAYLQAMLKAGYKPHSAIILQEENSPEEGLDKAVDEMEFFNPAESVLETLQRENIPYRKIPARGFNELAVIFALGQAEEEYHIFSGSGILKDEILSTGKKLIHIHPGKLPEYRGSTTFLYSLLAEGKGAATGFIMNKGIDTGDILASREFPPPAPNVDISRIYDPYIRSQVLVDVVRQLAEKGTLIGERQKLGGETYYMIHPVLRTLAIGYQRGELDTFNLG